jgi:tetratricopeptide (TPR) repeat protein
MSNLLNESIVDAKALRESALKNAESVVIEKYADEVKKTLESLLEQEEDLGMDTQPAEEAVGANGADVVEDQSDDVPLAATDGLGENEGINLDSLQSEGEDVEVTLDLGALQEAIEALATDLDEEIDLTIEEENLNEAVPEMSRAEAEKKFDKITDDGPGDMSIGHNGDKTQMIKIVSESATEELDEEIDVDPVDDDAAKAAADAEQSKGLDEDVDMDSLFNSVMEKLTADMNFDLSGWAGRPTSQIKDEKERELAHEASTDSEEEATLEEEQEELNESNEALEKALESNENLKEELVKYESAMEQLKENLYEVNLSNARLLYTNRVLRNSSLNERQKDKIVEAFRCWFCHRSKNNL